MIPRVFEMKNEVLRSVVIRELEGLLHGRGLHDNTLWDGFSEDVHTGERSGLGVDLFLDRGDCLVG
jgi:hypothetical protein